MDDDQFKAILKLIIEAGQPNTSKTRFKAAKRKCKTAGFTDEQAGRVMHSLCYCDPDGTPYPKFQSEN